MEYKNAEAVDEAKVAELRERFRRAYYLYLQKRTRWNSLFAEVDGLIMKPIPEDQIQRKIHAKVVVPHDADGKFDQRQAIEDLCLEPRPSKRWKARLCGVLAIAGVVWALLVLITETTLIFDKEKTIVYYWADSTPYQTFSIFLFTGLFLLGIVSSGLFTLLNLP